MRLILSLVFLVLSGFYGSVIGLNLRHISHSAQIEKDLTPNEAVKSAGATKWAVLVAGSTGFDNYRDQANICHAYQLLKKGGLKDENIVVFMYDDIAFHENNWSPGKIYNRPGGPDVYEGVPKDYSGRNATTHNLLSAIAGNKSAIRGGSGKVVASGPDDTVFIYYSGPGLLGIIKMPEGPLILPDDLVRILEKKHSLGGFKQLAFYLDATNSGEIFRDRLSANSSIYAMTSCNPKEASWAYYCSGDPGMDPQVKSACLGKLFSISWMEDIENHGSGTLDQNYQATREKTAHPELKIYRGSHVQRFGDLSLGKEPISTFIGSISSVN